MKTVSSQFKIYAKKKNKKTKKPNPEGPRNCFRGSIVLCPLAIYAKAGVSCLHVPEWDSFILTCMGSLDRLHCCCSPFGK